MRLKSVLPVTLGAAVFGLLAVGSSRPVLADGLARQECREDWFPKDLPAVCPFKPGPRLPSPRTYHASAATANAIYVAGGYVFDGKDVHYLDDLLYARIGADGTLGDWVSSPQRFTRGRSGLGLAALGKCLFLAGGSSVADGKPQYADDVQWSELNANGLPGAWRTSSQRLAVARSNATLLAYVGASGNFLYLVGGVTQIGPDTVHLDDVEYARVNADCSTSAWSRAAFHLHGGRSSPQAVLLDDQVAVIGGWGDVDAVDVYSDVELARIRPEGGLEPWRVASTRLPTGLYGHATVVGTSTGGPSLLLALGGQPGSGAYSNWLAYAYWFPKSPIINSITQWSVAPVGRLPTARAGHSAHLVNGFLYVIGGTTAGGQYLDEVLQSRVSAGEP